MSGTIDGNFDLGYFVIIIVPMNRKMLKGVLFLAGKVKAIARASVLK